jgi:RHS repeat-associated protein
LDFHDYLPFGEEIQAGVGGRSSTYYPPGPLAINDSTTLKFTGKERDAETGLDYFGARYFASPQGRWTSPDWSAAPAPVPYASLGDPQTLNLYGYVRNNPLCKADADGHQNPEAIIESPPVQALIEKAAPYVSGALGALGGLAVAMTDAFQKAAPAVVQALGESGPDSQFGSYQKLYLKDFQKSDARPGTLGKPDHKQTVKEEAERVKGRPEAPIPTPGGSKEGRRADADGTNPQTGGREIVQVYRPTPAGNIPKREQDAAADIQNATGVKPTMVPVRPLPAQPKAN